MPLASVEEATAFVAGKDVAVIGVFADQTKDAAKAYLAAAAANIDYIPFAITSSAEVAVEHKQQTAQKIFSGDIKSHLLAFLSVKADSHADDVSIDFSVHELMLIF